nr:Putative AC transposase [Ipomoea batatas]
MTSPSPSVNYSSSAPTGINAEFDFDSEMPSSRQPEPQSPSIEEIEQPNSEEPKPKRAKSTTSDVWKSFTKIGVVDGKEKASVILAIAVVLDPRLKFDMIQYCYKKFDPIGWETKLDVEYTDYSSENVSVIKKSDLDTYLEEGKLDTKSNMHLDVLQYWKEHQARFPCLSKMACDLLSIPITTVASEGSFSIGSRVLTKYRCSLLSENVQALICTRNWLQGYSCEDEDDEDGEIRISSSYTATRVLFNYECPEVLLSRIGLWEETSSIMIKCIVSYPDEIIKYKLVIDDDEQDGQLILWDNVCSPLLGITASELKGKYSEEGCTPNEIEGLIGKTMKFMIVTREDQFKYRGNAAFTILGVQADEAISNSFKKGEQGSVIRKLAEEKEFNENFGQVCSI